MYSQEYVSSISEAFEFCTHVGHAAKSILISELSVLISRVILYTNLCSDPRYVAFLI